MLTKREFKLPEVPKLLDPTENEKRLRDHAIELRRSISEVFRILNQPNVVAIDGVVIGGEDAAAGSFTTLAASGASTLTGAVGVGVAPPSGVKFGVAHAYAAISGAFAGTLLRSTDALAADKGGTLAFGGVYTNAGTVTQWAGITGLKENATDSNVAGYLTLGTRPAGGSITERLRITSDGRIYGTALHNNAGAVTGTTNQHIASGTYLPTLTNVANAGFLGANTAHWIRVGNVVTVSGSLTITPTAGTTNTQVGISLPIASALANHYELGGTAVGYTSGAVNQPASIVADATNDRAELKWYPPGTTSTPFYFVFSYVVL